MPALAVTDTNNLFGALEFSEKASQGRRAADRRRADSRSISATPNRCARSASRWRPTRGFGNLVLLAMDEQRLSQPDEAGLRRLDPSRAGRRPPHVALTRLREAGAGLIALTGGPDRPARPRLRRCTSDCSRTGAARRAFRNFSATALCRIAAPRDGRRERVEPALLDLAYRRDLPLVATNEPYFAARSDYDAHDALLCIAEGALVSDDNRRQLTPEHRFKTRAEMLENIRRSARGHRATAWRSRCAAPTARKPASRSCRNFTRQGPTRPPNCAARPIAGLKARLDAHGPAPGRTLEDYRQPARIRAVDHREDEVSRLFPDRRRLHQMGEDARAFRSGPGAAPARARWSPMRSPSPISTRCGFRCCSSGS